MGAKALGVSRASLITTAVSRVPRERVARKLQQAPGMSPGSPGRETPGPRPTYGLGTYTKGLLQLFCRGLVRVPVLQPGHRCEQALLAPAAKKRYLHLLATSGFLRCSPFRPSGVPWTRLCSSELEVRRRCRPSELR